MWKSAHSKTETHASRGGPPATCDGKGLMSNTVAQIETKLDFDLLKAWIKEAADTLRRLPRGHCKSRITYWPDVVQTTTYSFGYNEGNSHLAAPEPKAIDRMELFLTWLFACSDEERRVIWARALGMSWRKLEDVDGRSHVTLRRIEDRGLLSIHRHLRANPKSAPSI